MGSQFSVYSVSWSWPSVLAFGGKPRPKLQHANPRDAGDQEVAELVDQDQRNEDYQ